MQSKVVENHTAVAWMDNSVPEHVRRCNWRGPSADEHQMDGEVTSGLGPFSCNWKEQN
jgi:hypothetical protein